MDAFTRKLLASLVAIAMIASAFTGLVMTETAGSKPPTCPLDEDFSGSFPPSGWTTDHWDQSNTNYAGGTPPEARLAWFNISGNYSYLDSKPVDTTGMSSLTLEFKSFIDDYCYNGSYGCRVYTRARGGDSWTDVTPWSNPIYGNVGPDSYSVDISSDIGSATQLRFEFDGIWWCLDYWYVDDVRICGVTLPPSHLRYLHAEDGLIDLADPVGTQWHELWPFFCNEYHLSSWNDTRGDGVLSRSDRIDMYQKPDGAVKPYHVEDVTITLFVTQNETGESMYIEHEGGYNSSVLTNPVCTQWHEIYPNFCRQYHLTAWNDTNPNDKLDPCDYVLLTPKGLLICPLDEDFSAGFPPSGWARDDWYQSYTNNATGASPEARLLWDYISGNYSYLDSKRVDTTGACNLTLEFKSYIDDYGGGYNCTVYTRAHGGDSWTDVTPWSNPIYGNVGPDSYSVDISSDIGSATQVRFEFDGDSDNIDDWYVDDVKICFLPCWWHVEEVATDIVVTRETPPVGGEAYPVNKIFVLAPWIVVAVLLAGGTGWYVLRRRRAGS